MRSKAPLALMEQMVMLLVFALAAALCLQAFVKSDAVSTQSEARDRAVIVAQSAAETIRHYGGDAQNALSRAAQDLGGVYSEEFVTFDLNYDENWMPISPEEGARYRLCALAGVPEDPSDPLTVPSRAGENLSDPDVPGLQRASIFVLSGDGSGDQLANILFSIEIAWQTEVSAHE